MKIYSGLLIATLMCLCSCNQDKHKTSNGINADTLQVKPASQTSKEFNLDQVPISNKDLGKFPYLIAPEGYKYSGDKTQRSSKRNTISIMIV